MGKLSRMYRESAPPMPKNRLIMFGALLVVVIVALVALRSGVFTAPEQPRPQQTPFAPAQKPAPRGIKTTLGVDGDNVSLAVGDTPEMPTNDNSPLAAPEVDNNPFATLTDAEPFRWAEREVYYRAIDMAWELGKTPPAQTPPAVNRTLLFASPDRHRGKLVRITGRLIDVQAARYDPPADKKSDRPRAYWQCGIGNAKEGVMVVRVFVDPTEQGLAIGSDNVRCDAYFFKILAYDTAEHGRQYAPILFGYKLTRVPPPPTAPLDLFGTLVITALGGTAIVLYIFLRRSRQQGQSVRRRLEHDLADEVEIPEPHSLPRDEPADEAEQPNRWPDNP